jgi:hypothetical protein
MSTGPTALGRGPSRAPEPGLNQKLKARPKAEALLTSEGASLSVLTSEAC